MIFEKIREKIEEKAFSVQLKQGIKEPSTFDAMEEKFSVREIKGIINQVEAEYNNGWIPCKVELPKETQKSYLIYYKRHGGLNGCYNLSFVSKDYFMSDKRWEIEDRFPDAKVTHWQPLPQPPKGE